MKAMVCEMCASHDLVKQDGMFVCQSCGTKYSVEDAKKLLLDVTGSTVKIDVQDKIDNLYILARRARTEGNNQNAAKYYQEILIEDPNSWEAAFYSVYFTSSNCVIGQIASAANNLGNAFVSAFNLINEKEPEEKRQELLYELHDNTSHLLDSLSLSATSHFLKFATVDGATSEYKARVYACGMASLKMGDKFYSIGDKRVASIAYKNAEALFRGQYHINDLAKNRIKEYEPSYELKEKSGGCYVATAVYGSYDCPQVWTLRRFRDNTLAASWYGRVFIHTYYAISPTLVKWFGNTEWFKNMWKPTLDRMVRRLNSEGVQDTPYNDRKW